MTKKILIQSDNTDRFTYANAYEHKAFFDIANKVNNKKSSEAEIFISFVKVENKVMAENKNVIELENLERCRTIFQKLKVVREIHRLGLHISLSSMGALGNRVFNISIIGHKNNGSLPHVHGTQNHKTQKST